MGIQIFFSWQSDTDKKYNTNLIQKALKTAIERLEKAKADFRFKPMLDRAGDPKLAGSPNIVSTINKKIRNADIFIADVTYVAKIQVAAKGKAKQRTKGLINSNVAIELGQAKSLLGDERIIKVMNAAYGSPDEGIELPFDIEQDRHPILYTAINKTDIKDALKEVTEILYYAIDNILRDHETLQKERFKPLLTYNKWGEFVERSVLYVHLKALTEKKNTLHEQLKSTKSIVRVSGLAGIGKSRFVYESLSATTPNSAFLSGSILYYDAASQQDNNISERISELTAEGESFVFVVDNVPPELHDRLSKIIVRHSSTSSLITISSEVDEMITIGEGTVHIQLEADLGEQIAFAILQNRFSSADYFTLKQAIAAVGGLPSLAVSLVKQPELNVQMLTQVTSTNWINTVLGQQAKEGNIRSVLRTLGAFGVVGFDGELAQQAKLLAEDDLITPLDGLAEKQRWQRFQFFVRTYLKKGILKQKGRYITVQSQHIALQLAREWWQAQSENIVGVLESVQGTPLAAAMFKQLQQLSLLPLAQQLVVSFCQLGGPLGQASVLLSAEGANFIRYLADVNPKVVTVCLARELLPLSLVTLKEAVDSRRSLVGALEKLCRYERTFEMASRVLLRLAAAENEQINNNAIGQFRHLYQYDLAGTAANYSQRINTLQYGVSQKDPKFDRIVIAACSTALTPNGVSRMVSEPDQYQSWQEFYPATYDELWAYWEQIVTILKNYAEDSTHPSNTEAADSIIRSLPGVVKWEGTHVLIPAIESLLQANLLPRKRVHQTVKFVLSSRQGYIRPTDVIRLEQLIEQTKPVSFEDKLEQYVFDFADTADFQKIGEALLEQRAVNLVPAFLQRPDLWQKTAIESYGKNPFYTTAFFKEAAIQLTAEPLATQQLLAYLLEGLKKNVTGEYSISNSLTGFLLGAGPAITETTLRQLIQDPELRHLTFHIAGQVTTNRVVLEELLQAVEQGDMSVNGFAELRYSRILSNLSQHEFEQLVNRIAAISTAGKWVVLLLLWDRHDAAERQLWGQLINQLLLTQDLWSVNVDFELEHKALYALSKLIGETTDASKANAYAQQVISYVATREVWQIRGDLYQPLKVLLEKHFTVAWPIIAEALSTEEGWGLYKYLGSSTTTRPTGSEQYEEVGLLFEFGDYDQILNWCRSQPLPVLWRFANNLPVTSQDSPDTWHPFTRRFIDEFGQDESILREIRARMNSWHSNGSVEELYLSYKTLFNRLINHPLSTVQNWALRQIELAGLRAKGERVFMEELYLKR